MLFTETDLKGAYIIEPEILEDERGFFARVWCQKEFEANGLNPRLVQCSVSFNKRKGTLRGMHYQSAPFQETKLVRCITGGVYDVIIDLRSDSLTYKKWSAHELTATNRRMLYIPEGFAHGFQTLEDGTELSYQMSEFYSARASTGIRWNDDAFRIEWPIDEKILSKQDESFANFVG